ncbi:hypothetical protein ACWEVD_02635 [Nocardia thailandica]|uniref:hypothetical protein n=1 Tax=Nocardia thailandica TaxID=257275 RepID=UPI0005BE5661|nr:hypothetical protein [Nocardia thailandica]
MTASPIADLAAEHLRRVRMLRAEFEDERARLQARGDELLAVVEATAQDAVDRQDDEPAAAEPSAPVSGGGRHREPEPDEPTVRIAQAAVLPPVPPVAEPPAAHPSGEPRAAVSTSGAGATVDDEVSRREIELREAREAIARSIAARRARQNFDPVDYEGYDQESEYYRRKNWLE